MITVKINGQNKEVKDNTTVADFLKTNNINPVEVTVEHNFEIVNPESVANITLKSQDTLEILRFVGGG